MARIKQALLQHGPCEAASAPLLSATAELPFCKTVPFPSVLGIQGDCVRAKVRARIRRRIGCGKYGRLLEMGVLFEFSLQWQWHGCVRR